MAPVLLEKKVLQVLIAAVLCGSEPNLSFRFPLPTTEYVYGGVCQRSRVEVQGKSNKPFHSNRMKHAVGDKLFVGVRMKSVLLVGASFGDTRVFLSQGQNHHIGFNSRMILGPILNILVLYSCPESYQKWVYFMFGEKNNIYTL